MLQGFDHGGGGGGAQEGEGSEAIWRQDSGGGRRGGGGGDEEMLEHGLLGLLHGRISLCRPRHRRQQPGLRLRQRPGPVFKEREQERPGKEARLVSFAFFASLVLVLILLSPFFLLGSHFPADL